MLDFIVENWENIFVCIAAMLTFVGAIVAITPTKTDDAVFSVVKAWVEKIVSFVRPKKEVVKEIAEKRKKAK